MKVYKLLTSIDDLYHELAMDLKETVLMQRGEWQANSLEDPQFATHDLSNVVINYFPSASIKRIQKDLKPDLPWAEEHFKERVSGIPHNPPPSFRIWPYHKGHEEDYLKQGEFAHTYPERFWPAKAKNADGNRNFGIRYSYGDLFDVVNLLKIRPFTRQAFLPVWFPEDTGAREHQRVPCTIGYHFIRNGVHLDCNYFLRSCDITRHLKNDIYLAARLLQWVKERVHTTLDDDPIYPLMGELTLFISNLHMFKGDEWRF